MCIGFRARRTPRMASLSSEVKWARFWPCWRRAVFSPVFCDRLRGWPLGNEVAFSLSQFGAFCDPEILRRRSFLKKRGLVLTLSACPFSKLLLALSPPLLNIGCSQHASSSWLLVVIPSLLDELHSNQLHLIMISEGPVFIRSHYWQVRYAQSISPSPHARTISIWSVQLFVLPDPAGRSPVFVERRPHRPCGALFWFCTPGAHNTHPRVCNWLLLLSSVMDCISISCGRPEFRFSSLARCIP